MQWDRSICVFVGNSIQDEWFGKTCARLGRRSKEQAKGDKSFIHTPLARPARVYMVFETQLLKLTFLFETKGTEFHYEFHTLK